MKGHQQHRCTTKDELGPYISRLFLYFACDPAFRSPATGVLILPCRSGGNLVMVVHRMAAVRNDFPQAVHTWSLSTPCTPWRESHYFRLCTPVGAHAWGRSLAHEAGHPASQHEYHCKRSGKENIFLPSSSPRARMAQQQNVGADHMMLWASQFFGRRPQLIQQETESKIFPSSR